MRVLPHESRDAHLKCSHKANFYVQINVLRWHKCAPCHPHIGKGQSPSAKQKGELNANSTRPVNRVSDRNRLRRSRLSSCYFLYKRSEVSPAIYFALGIYLIAVALGLVYILGSLNAIARFKLTASEYEVVSLQSQVALYIFPFISAAIGTNLITTAKPENKKPKSPGK